MDTSISFCSKCKDKTCIKSGKPCKRVESYLKAEGIYSRDWIRPKVSRLNRSPGTSQWREIPFSQLGHKNRVKLGIEDNEEFDI